MTLSEIKDAVRFLSPREFNELAKYMHDLAESKLLIESLRRQETLSRVGKQTPKLKPKSNENTNQHTDAASHNTERHR